MPDTQGPAPRRGGSRWNAGREPRIGGRVMVRRLLPDGSSHPMTDVLGHVVALEPLLVVRREDGEEVTLHDEEVAVLKVLPPRPVRARDMRTLEYTCALGWPGTEFELVDGWMCRAGDDWSYRRDSAVPVLPWASVDQLDGVCAWYAARGLPTRLVAVERLVELERPAVPVMEEGRELLLSTGAAAGPAAVLPGPDARLTLADAPDDDWLELYHGTAGLDPARVRPAIISTAGLFEDRPVPGGMAVFARLEIDGRPVAIARGSVTTGPDGVARTGISCVETDPTRRRQGLAEIVTGALARWGRELGSEHLYLHVFADNAAGRALWTKVGLTPHHASRHVLLG